MYRALILILLVGVMIVFGQRRYRGERRSRGVEDVPSWEVNRKFERDVFTFVRIEYDSWGGRGWRKWETDYPDGEMNLSYRLQQMTAIKVSPKPITRRLTDPDLFSYPFIYIVEPGNLIFSEEEVVALRNYLDSGGFLMVDDFWGEDEWQNFYEQIKRVYPDREPEELQTDHPIFSCVFPLKEKPQIPNVWLGTESQFTGVTWERWDAREVHMKAIYDDNKRMTVIICHNTDLGDGWEREGDNEYYFREFSEKKAFPLGINIIFYALTN
jgi:hypothetical protein